MQRFRVDLSYDGSSFHGWAKQPGLRTVQSVVEESLVKIIQSKDNIAVTVAGRTDSGVHARNQTIHFDLSDDNLDNLAKIQNKRKLTSINQTLLWRLEGILRSENPDVGIVSVQEVDNSFDARFSALQRHYEYLVSDYSRPYDSIMRNYVLHYSEILELELMQQAAAVLEGLHDFATFCKPREGASTVRHLQSFTWSRLDNGILSAKLSADAFCHSMVRALVGACISVGAKKMAVSELRKLLAAAERTSRFKVVKPHGLFLDRVDYPPAALWEERALQTRGYRGAGCAAHPA